MKEFSRKYPLVKFVVLVVLAVLTYETVRRPGARAAEAPASAVAISSDSSFTTFHVADADADVGPGEAEPALAQHP